MAKKVLDLSHTLQPLENEFREIVTELIHLKEEESPLFDAAVEDFINKYGGLQYHSLDELLLSSAAQAAAMATAMPTTHAIPLDDLLKDLIP